MVHGQHCRPSLIYKLNQNFSKKMSTLVVYLLLQEMGKTDAEISSIMGLSDSGLRTIRNRVKPLND